MTITLIGYRGSGKSSIAPLLATALDWNWIDSDQVIEEEAGCTIRQIFESEGEAGFRARETQVLERLLKQPRLVIAAGGGAVLAPINRERMQAAGPVVWLCASADTLASRISGDQQSATRRPGLTALSASEEVASVLAYRLPIYLEAATISVDADGRSLDEITADILAQLPPFSDAANQTRGNAQ
ncbi:MAG: shikimate kinase [Planctomyces sp.]|nr:shikimate kinase [Planctomyces sp.]